MENIEIHTHFGDKPTKIEISAPMGIGGATYFVAINNYHQGDLLKTADGWKIHLHGATILSGDDVAIIIDRIEEQFDHE